ncbi:MAG: hypothetical protein P3W91_001110 [Fervidobacterium sp.]|nr:hypothetical protein [Fervidobacterium sp.]
MIKALFIIGGIGYLLLIGAWLHERKSHFQTIDKYAQCQAELKSTQENLVRYTQLYIDLRNKCELDKKQIEQRYSTLLKKSLEPIPQVHIPQTQDEYQALKEIIDEALSHFNK